MWIPPISLASLEAVWSSYYFIYKANTKFITPIAIIGCLPFNQESRNHVAWGENVLAISLLRSSASASISTVTSVDSSSKFLRSLEELSLVKLDY